MALIRALGGGWTRSQLPTDQQMEPFGTFQFTISTSLGESVSTRTIDNNLTKPCIPRTGIHKFRIFPTHFHYLPGTCGPPPRRNTCKFSKILELGENNDCYPCYGGRVVAWVGVCSQKEF